MGINLSLYSADQKEWAGWDCSRYSLDREFAAGEGLEMERFPLEWDYGVPIEFGFRPINFPAWRERFCGEDAVNSERLTKALDFLESNPGSYAYAGY